MDIRKHTSQKYTVELTFYNIILKYTPYGQAEWKSELMNVAGNQQKMWLHINYQQERKSL